MDIDEQIDNARQRDYFVVKANHLIQKSRYELSVTEQRTIAYICSMIKPVEPLAAAQNVPYQLDYEFNIREYAKICGLYYEDGGKLYSDTKALLKGLLTKVIYIELPDGTEGMLTWLAEVWTDKQNGKAKINISPRMAPFLFDLKEKFTAYGLLNILAMKSQYSIRIYELMRSHAYQKLITYETEKLKKMFMVENIKSYGNFKDFRRRILEPAITEINKYTDLQVSYEAITKGRKVVKIQFYISKKPITERHIAWTIATGKIEK